MTSTPVEVQPAHGGPLSAIRWPRMLLTLATIPLGWTTFKHAEPTYIPLLGDIDVAVHEFGHVLFGEYWIPLLGHWMMVMGGSLTQIAFPLVFVWYFLRRAEPRDLHAASLCLWWSSLNVKDVAIYMADARARDLMLLSGMTGQEDDSGHDWYQLLSHWHLLDRDTYYASRLRALGWVMFLASVAIGVYAASTVRAGAGEGVSATA